MENRLTQMTEMRASGKRLQEIADVFGITRERVRQLVGHIKLPTNIQRATEMKDYVADCVAKGKSLKEISKETDIDVGALRKSIGSVRAIRPASTQKERSRRYYKTDAWRNANLLRAYGITIEKYNEILESQGGGCAICGKIGFRLCVDHDHKTGEVRGILCRTCNAAIGFLGDTADGVLKALRYLEK